jgi:cyclic beta-1,2-glucan synthetase
MLEWQPAARTNGAAARSTTRVFFEQMLGSPLFAVGALLIVAISRPSALKTAAPVLVLWIVAPLIASRLSRPVPLRQPEIRTADYQLFRLIARKTWRYFDTFVGSEDHYLPPDNCQQTPDTIVAHRTSPTNIGMGLLAVLAAHDLGFIQTPALVERIDHMLTTMEGMTQFEGHLFNWYDTQSLAPLSPRYVSSVDSGNLASALLTLAVGLRELAEGVPEITDFVGLEEVATLLHRAITKAESEKVVGLADRRPLKEAVSSIRSIVVDVATSNDEKLAKLAGQLGTVEAVTAELDAGPDDVRH